MANREVNGRKYSKQFAKGNTKLTSTSVKVSRFYNEHKGSIHSLLGIILAFLVIISIYRLSIGQSIPLFTDLLDIISSSPSLQIPSLSSGVNITVENLGIFGFLSPILNILVTAVDLIVFIVNGLINLITFAFHFLNWIFVRG